MPDSQGLFPEPPAPAGVKTSPALESRDTVFLFLFIFFSSSMVPGSEAGSCSSSSGPGCVCYPDSDLMFRLAVASSAPSVCDRCRGHTAGKRAKGGLWRREADLQRVCVHARLSQSILCSPRIHSHVYVPLSEPASGCAFCQSASSERSTKGPATSVLIRPWHV